MFNPLTRLASAIMEPIREFATKFIVRGILGAVALVLVLLLLLCTGCGALRTKVQWDIGDGTGTGWIQGPGSAKAEIIKADGTKIKVEIERPTLWSANVPQVMNLGATRVLE